MSVIAIDGPAGAGKSTVARRVAQRLGFEYIDTGAMYRAIALFGIEASASGEELASRLHEIELEATAGRIYLNGIDVSDRIRSADVTRAVPSVSADPRVRARLIDLQRSLAATGEVVMEGRDIGTSIWPQAEVKIFLSASLDARAARRLRDSDSAGQDLARVRSDIEARDRTDSARSVSPLKKATDAIEIETTSMTVEEVVDAILDVARGAGIHG